MSSALLPLNNVAPSRSESAAGTGPAIRMASVATLKETPARRSPAPTDMAIAIVWCGIRKNDPLIAPIGSPAEDKAPHVKAVQTSSGFVDMGRPRLSLRRAASQLVRQRLVARRELERDRVDAVAQPGGRWAVRENMPLMAAASGAEQLAADYPVAGVALCLEMLFIEWRGEA